MAKKKAKEANELLSIKFRFRFNQQGLNLWSIQKDQEVEHTKFTKDRYGAYVFHPYPDKENEFLSLTIFREYIKLWARINEKDNPKGRHFSWKIPRSPEIPEYNFGVPIENEMEKNESNNKWINKK